ncbi:MAG: cytidine deaminase, partial [Anaerorhabdus sp.]
MKRENVLNWDQYFMGLAHLSALRSKDPSTQVGAVIVDSTNRVVSIGYNGLPRGCNDDEFPWGREGGMLESKYAFVVHAELNAILNSPRPVKECSIY